MRWCFRILTEEQLNIVNSTEKVVMGIARAGCVDSETEFFDGFKWNRISKYDGENVTQFNPITRLPEVIAPIRYIKSNKNVSFDRYNNIRFDMVLTKDHNVVLHSMDDDNYTKISSEQLIERIKSRNEYNIPFYYSEDFFRECLKGNAETFKHSVQYSTWMKLKDEFSISKFEGHDGFKYCFEVPSGMLVLRRSGKIFITGNSGKSYTAVHYAKKKSQEGHKILYIVFNKSLQKSAEDDFKGVNNVTVSTIHSLAYKGTQAFRYKDKLTGSYNAKDLADDLNMRNFNDAGYLYYLWNKYLTSDYKNLDDFCENHVKGNKQYKTKMIHKLEELWKLKLDQSSDVKIEHNFYLKLFHIDGFKLIDDYTCLIADEVNDYNHLMKDMFINSKCEYKLALGDPQQTIYSFNGVAEDVFGEIAKTTGGTKYPLSVSFRIGSENSMVCNHIYNDMSDGKEFVIFGENKNQKVYIKSHLEPKDFDKSCVLSRTNGALLDYAISGAKAGKWLGFIGGINNYKFDFYVNLYFFSRGIKQKDQFFNKFRDWAELLHYTEESEDIELLSAINIVKRHNCKLPDYVKLIKEMTVKDTNKCDMLLSTVHRIKGATISVPVFIGEDLVNLEKLQAQLDILDYENAPESHLDRFYKDCEEELNVLYVALTRSNGCLYLNRDLTNYCRKKGIL